MDYELLQLKTIHEVRALVREKGMRWVKTEKKVDLIERLREIPEPIKPEDVTPQPEVLVHTATQDEILEVIADNIKRGIKIKFTEDSWQMRSAQGREDSGSLTVPLNVIKRIANLMTGA